ncbi:uncharacterized protein LOC124113652 [Haliotis rufescens]|uniref:uncharacterized protein LOC124113652 n=1 Tax=Haliotis rufescens TaxID=6454 RepID=UPI00201EF9B9|nr:uncharacterized protein LOC124113652 [Haliotis rufescens]
MIQTMMNLLTIVIATGLAAVVRGNPAADLCPGHVECGTITQERYTAAAGDVTKQCKALYFGLDCLDRVRMNCSASKTFGLSEAIKFAREQLNKLNCTYAIQEAAMTNGSMGTTGVGPVAPGYTGGVPGTGGTLPGTGAGGTWWQPAGSVSTPPTIPTVGTQMTPPSGDAGRSCQSLSLVLTIVLISGLLSFF